MNMNTQTAIDIAYDVVNKLATGKLDDIRDRDNIEALYIVISELVGIRSELKELNEQTAPALKAKIEELGGDSHGV